MPFFDTQYAILCAVVGIPITCMIVGSLVAYFASPNLRLRSGFSALAGGILVASLFFELVPMIFSNTDILHSLAVCVGITVAATVVLLLDYAEDLIARHHEDRQQKQHQEEQHRLQHQVQKQDEQNRHKRQQQYQQQQQQYQHQRQQQQQYQHQQHQQHQQQQQQYDSQFYEHSIQDEERIELVPDGSDDDSVEQPVPAVPQLTVIEALEQQPTAFTSLPESQPVLHVPPPPSQPPHYQHQSEQQFSTLPAIQPSAEPPLPTRPTAAAVSAQPRRRSSKRKSLPRHPLHHSHMRKDEDRDVMQHDALPAGPLFTPIHTNDETAPLLHPSVDLSYSSLTRMKQGHLGVDEYPTRARFRMRRTTSAPPAAQTVSRRKWFRRNESSEFPIGAAILIAIDGLSDGLVIGITTSLTLRQGLVISAALAMEMLVTGAALSGILYKNGVQRRVAVPWLVAIPFTMLLGASLGRAVVNSVSTTSPIFAGILSFTVGQITYLATTQLYSDGYQEAKNQSSFLARMCSMFFFVGILSGYSLQAFTE